MTLRPNTTILLVLALVAGACSLLVSPEQAEIKCEVSKGSKDPCPGAMTCVDKVCKTIPAQREENCEDGVDNDGDDMVDEHDDSIPEECNEVDDDCDGHIDEGFADALEICDNDDNNCNGKKDEGFDQDGDGHTACGDLSLRQGTYDCEPMQAAAHPGAKEICDGLDNDCDGNTDNAPAGESLCPGSDPDKEKTLCLAGRCVRKTCSVADSGMTCGPKERCVEDKCVPMDCGTPCGMNQFCDMTTSPPSCKDSPQQRAVGEACSSDAECQDGLFCIDGEALNLTSPRRVCGKACCSDANCGPTETCFAASTGARSCVPRSRIANSYPTGSKACSALNQCAAPQVCLVDSVTQTPGSARILTPFCRAPSSVGTIGVAEQCQNAASCSTRLCQPLVLSSVCTTPCNVSSDCAKLSEYRTLAPVHAFCQYVDYGQYTPSTSGVHYGPMCFAVASSEAPPAGPPIKDCRTNTDCPDQTCIGASVTMNKPGRCAPTCCQDSQCTTLRPNARCVPVARGTRRYEMRCME